MSFSDLRSGPRLLPIVINRLVIERRASAPHRRLLGTLALRLWVDQDTGLVSADAEQVTSIDEARITMAEGEALDVLFAHRPGPQRTRVHLSMERE